MDTTFFQYCPKLVVFRNNDQEVLLVRRTGEQDYNATYSFIGGKIETTDANILEGIRREKIEEVGSACKIQVLDSVSWNVQFKKKDGNTMIIPHHYAHYISGEIVLSNEYDDYKWVQLSELESFTPKIENIQEAARQVLQIKALCSNQRTVEL